MTEICSKCQKQVLLNGFTCKCGQVTCIKHRFEHPCTFDYKRSFQEKLTKENPSVIKDKLQKI